MFYEKLKNLETHGGALVIVPSFYPQNYAEDVTATVCPITKWEDVLSIKKQCRDNLEEYLECFNRTIVFLGYVELKRMCDRYIFDLCRQSPRPAYVPGVYNQAETVQAFFETLDYFYRLGYMVVLM